MEAKVHTPVYTMHKYFARRPWNVFNQLISHYSSPGDIVLDPFAGGGVTVVESLKLRRRVVGVDVNPLAIYIASMETRPLDLHSFEETFSQLKAKLKDEICSLYVTRCEKCNELAIADWIEWDENKQWPIRLKYGCDKCGNAAQKATSKADRELAEKIDHDFSRLIQQRKLWYPETSIPTGDKSHSLITQGFHFFHELFTKRNLIALAILFDAINGLQDTDERDFLKFAFSSSLKWTSRLSHLRGRIVEGWAMHAYWVYPKSLEINVWNTFERRTNALTRGKRYSSEHIGDYCRFAHAFSDIASGAATCLLLNRSSAQLPLPADSVDTIITDPPYGGNVNYGELSDFWWVWLSGGATAEKRHEAVINRTQGKTIDEYEEILVNVFSECYRVLKPERCLVSTFNSKDIRVVASFVKATSIAGFSLHPEGLLYQKPIRPYATTFHAMQIGAFVGDFIFTFLKTEVPSSVTKIELIDLKSRLDELMTETSKDEAAETKLRIRVYRALIPFLADRAKSDPTACQEAANYFEVKIRERNDYFSQLRKHVIERRRKKFQHHP
ncbi:MAG TPA: DNA methyltransferase [Candidatus Bathyarchaeia archaeon]|nr:DNA methyltransferase [Candidatus Bathyarchaeia archaeon]